MDLRQAAEAGHDSRQQEDRQVSLVLADPRIPLRDDLVPGGRQAHDAVAMDATGAVDVAAWQDERVLRVEPVRSADGACAGDTRRAGETAADGRPEAHRLGAGRNGHLALNPSSGFRTRA